MATLADLIANVFSTTLELEVDSSFFSFRNRENFLTVPTKIGIEPSGKRITSVGGRLRSSSEGVEFDLFGDVSRFPGELRRVDLIEAFIRYGIQETYRRRILLKPFVQITGLSRLQAALPGEDIERQMTEACALAGAHKTTFLS